MKYCNKCPLGQDRPIVWGEGSLNANLFFIGEAPGADEQEELRPFVGRSGKLLRKILNEINITEKDFYISNIVKHRPPNNRDPFGNEVQACQSYLLEEIKEVRPKLIITLGKVPGSWYNHYKPFEWFTYYPEKLWMPVYHPSYLLRNRKKIDLWKEKVLEIYERRCK